jgi:hypothetical protein
MTEAIELLRRLEITAGMRLWLINVPPAIAEGISAGAEVEIARKDQDADGAIVFCESADDVENWSEQVGELPPGSLVWFAYRDGAAGLGPQAGWAPLERAGWRGSKPVILPDGWAGVRFRRNVANGGFNRN